MTKTFEKKLTFNYILVGTRDKHGQPLGNPRLTRTRTRQTPHPPTLGFSQPGVQRVWVHRGYTMGTPTGYIHVRRFKYLYTSTVVKSMIIVSPGLRRPSLAAVGLRGLS